MEYGIVYLLTNPVMPGLGSRRDRYLGMTAAIPQVSPRLADHRLLPEIFKTERVIDYGNIKRVSMQRLWLYHNWHQERSYLGHVWRNRNQQSSKEMP